MATSRVLLQPNPQHSKVFSKLGLIGPSIDYMTARYSAPTPIQELAIPPLLKGTSALISAETGTGKTLAYLLPLVQRFKSFEERRLHAPQTTTTTTRAAGKYNTVGPRILLFSPTRELCTQLFGEAKKLSHELKFKVRLWGNAKPKLGLDTVPDMVVCSPDAYFRDNKYNPELVESLVLDEVDAMLFHNSGFTESITKLVDSLHPDCQIVCVGATALKGDAWEWLQHVRGGGKRGEGCVKIKSTAGGDLLLPSTIRVNFSNVEEHEGYDKHFALERALMPFLTYSSKAPTMHPRCIIFCNSVASCRSTNHLMEERFSDVCTSYCLHGEMRPMQRDEAYHQFIAEEEKDGKKKLKVLVCTDLTSRGIDVANVTQVIVFDVPNSLPDLIHRCGRTGRAGKSGVVTFVVGRGEKQKVSQLLMNKN